MRIVGARHRNSRAVLQGQLKAVIALLDTAGTGAGEVRFCMASALAVLILDEDIMEAVRARGEAPAMFVHSIAIVRSALAALAPDAPAPPDDPAGTVAMAEATAQAMWGAAYYCTLPGGGGIEDAHVVRPPSAHILRRAETPLFARSRRACKRPERCFGFR